MQLGPATDESAEAGTFAEVGHAALQLLDELEHLEEDLREARRIGVWLYDHLSPGAHILLGDVSEWPWLVSNTEER